MARPMVSVHGADGAAVEQVALPAVFSTPLRPDLVQTVHRDLAKNARQAIGVNRLAGHQHSAESWGTGRAVSRIPRVAGSGTHRAGQAAFGNMCRGGRMFAPTKTWRRWHRKVSLGQKRYAVASALAASAVPALVMSRGHKIGAVPELPLVLSDDVSSLSKTSKALELLQAVGAVDDVKKAKASKKLRRGKGKMRNRRYVSRKGPLVIHSGEGSLEKAVRNLPGVDTCHVGRLNLLQLAPGGHLGRFCVWTKGAVEAVAKMYGEGGKFEIPANVMTNSDLSRLINSDEIQSVVAAPKEGHVKLPLKSNPLKNKAAMAGLNPYTGYGAAANLSSSKSKGQKAVGKAFLAKMVAESEYDNEDCTAFSVWLTEKEKEKLGEDNQ